MNQETSNLTQQALQTVKTPDHTAIEAQLSKLYGDLAIWQRKAESDIIKCNWHGIAATNCTIINSKIDALKYVLSGTPLQPVYTDDGSRYDLSV